MPNNYSGKPSIDGCMAIEAKTFSKHYPNTVTGSITWSSGASIGYTAKKQDESYFVVLSYLYKGEEVEEVIKMVSQEVNFGGLRWYFICPYTGKRCKKLIRPSGIKYFKHRTAFNIIYYSQRHSKGDRIRSKGWMPYEKKTIALYEEMMAKNGRWRYNGKWTKKAKRYFKRCDKTKKANEAIEEHLMKFFGSSGLYS